MRKRYRGHAIASIAVTLTEVLHLGTVINESIEPNASDESAQTHTVLIVDDNAEDRYLLKRYLKKTGLTLLVLEVSNGQEGLDLLTSPIEELAKEYPELRPPVILFLDINMPLMNGWEFIEALETRVEEIQLKPTVVMMYSTSDADDEKKKANRYQTVAGYIVKGSSSPENLRQAILDGAAQG